MSIKNLIYLTMALLVVGMLTACARLEHLYAPFMPDLTPMVMNVFIDRNGQTTGTEESDSLSDEVESRVEASLTARFDSMGFTSESIESASQFEGGSGAFLVTVKSIRYELGSSRRPTTTNPASIRVSYSATDSSRQEFLSDDIEQVSSESVQIAINRTCQCVVWRVTEGTRQHLGYERRRYLRFAHQHPDELHSQTWFRQCN